jgi:hypothetical protein
MTAITALTNFSVLNFKQPFHWRPWTVVLKPVQAGLVSYRMSQFDWLEFKTKIRLTHVERKHRCTRFEIQGTGWVRFLTKPLGGWWSILFGQNCQVGSLFWVLLHFYYQLGSNFIPPDPLVYERHQLKSFKKIFNSS